MLSLATFGAGFVTRPMVFQPQRAVMFGHAPTLTREQLEQRAERVAALFLRGCAG